MSSTTSHSISFARKCLLKSAVTLVAVTTLLAFAGVPAGATHEDPAAPNDPLLAEQWGLAQVNAEGAWDLARGGDIVIAIIDNGVDLDHEDLQASVVGGNTFRECGETGCGNGDWESEPPAGGSPVDDTLNQFVSAPYHGTHVAGIAAAIGNNGVGVSGVAPEAKILSVKVLGAFSGTIADVVLGIHWAVDNGADVINMSLASPGGGVLTTAGDSPELVAAVEYANSRGVVVVAGAGNEMLPLCDTPAFEEGVICVTATDRDELPADYGNRPIKPDLIAVSAPGGGQREVTDIITEPFGLGSCDLWILSTVPPGTLGDFCGGPSGYARSLGTSMATPHVAGATAVLMSQGRTRADVVKLLTCTARNPVTGQRGVWDPVYGFGIVDTGAAASAELSNCPGGATVEGPSSEDETEENNEKGKGKDKDKKDKKEKKSQGGGQGSGSSGGSSAGPLLSASASPIEVRGAGSAVSLLPAAGAVAGVLLLGLSGIKARRRRR